MRLKQACAGVAIVLAVGCSDLVTDSRPEQARLVLSGEVPVDIRVITSTRFSLYVDPATGETGTLLQEADTADLRPPFDETYEISQFGVFLVRVINADTTEATFNVNVSIDGETKLDQTLIMRAADGNAASYEWRWLQ